MSTAGTIIKYSIRAGFALGGSYLIYWYAGPVASIVMRHHADLLCPPPASMHLSWWDWSTTPNAIWDSGKYFAGCGAAKEQASHWVFDYTKYYAESWYAKAAMPVSLFYLDKYHSWTYSAFKRLCGKSQKPSASPYAHIPVANMVELFTALRHGKAPSTPISDKIMLERIKSRLSIIKSEYVEATADPNEEISEISVEEKKYEFSPKTLCTLLEIEKVRAREKQKHKNRTSYTKANRRNPISSLNSY